MATLLSLVLLLNPLHASPEVTATTLSGWRPDTQAARIWLKRHMPKHQWRCLDTLWSNESGWRVLAGDPNGAYGIPQAYPGRKMRAFGSDWRTNAMTQVRWGKRYIKGRYDGRPCKALRFQNRYGWY